MLRGILWAVLAVALVVGGYVLYKQHYPSNDLGSGDVVSRKVDDSSGGTTNTDIDGNSMNAGAPTPSRSDTPGTINGATASATGTGAGNQLTTTQEPTPQSGVVAGSTSGTMRSPEATTTYSQSAAPASLPVSDSISPNPPNGMVFAGTGAYQWYRQGNITWRVDSKGGRACIAFATMEEWQKSIVIRNGCGRLV